jgi:dTDP-4-amino-4,6-dideoxygalactose transaminase
MIKIAEPFINSKEIKAVVHVLKSHALSQGKNVNKFEEEFSKYLGVKYAIATSNGTTALHTALWSLGIGNGDEVITTPFSFIASSNCILMVGAKPVFVDINEKIFNIDPDKIEEKITKKTRAILIVHLYGQPCDMEPIMKIARKYDLYLIEDACQAHGAEYKGKKVGSFGDVACFSFYATKNMTTGEGGMVVTNDKKIAEKCRLFISHGEVSRYKSILLGYNYRMTEIQAAIGLEQLKKLDNLNKVRIKNAKFLTNCLKNIEEVETPYVMSNVKHIFHQYTIKVKRNRDRLKEFLWNAGIETKIFYPILISQQPLYLKLGYRDKLPIAENVSKSVISLPVHPLLKKRELYFICKQIKKFFGY